jgi:pyruvate kinase
LPPSALLDDGAIELEVTSVSNSDVVCKVIHGGVLKENKSVNLPDTELIISAVNPEYRDDVVREVTFAADNDVDYLAASLRTKCGRYPSHPEYLPGN